MPAPTNASTNTATPQHLRRSTETAQDGSTSTPQHRSTATPRPLPLAAPPCAFIHTCVPTYKPTCMHTYIYAWNHTNTQPYRRKGTVDMEHSMHLMPPVDDHHTSGAGASLNGGMGAHEGSASGLPAAHRAAASGDKPATNQSVASSFADLFCLRSCMCPRLGQRLLSLGEV